MFVTRKSVFLLKSATRRTLRSKAFAAGVLPGVGARAPRRTISVWIN